MLRQRVFDENARYCVSRPLGSSEYPVGSLLPRKHPHLAPHVWKNRLQALFRQHAIEVNTKPLEEYKSPVRASDMDSVPDREMLMKMSMNELRKLAKREGISGGGKKVDIAARFLANA